MVFCLCVFSSTFGFIASFLPVSSDNDEDSDYLCHSDLFISITPIRNLRYSRQHIRQFAISLGVLWLYNIVDINNEAYQKITSQLYWGEFKVAVYFSRRPGLSRSSPAHCKDTALHKHHYSCWETSQAQEIWVCHFHRMVSELHPTPWMMRKLCKGKTAHQVQRSDAKQSQSLLSECVNQRSISPE